MSQQELLKKVVVVLERLGIEYMLTGSVVSSIQGEPRSTHDIDVVVFIQEAAIEEFVKAFPQQKYYIDQDSVYEALQNKTMFNLIDTTEGDKVDFWILTQDKFDQSRFQRRYSENLFGTKMFVSRPEDTILAKLRWAKLCGGSEKQLTDAIRLYEVQYHKLDLEYLEWWVDALEINSLWERLKREAQII